MPTCSFLRLFADDDGFTRGDSSFGRGVAEFQFFRLGSQSDDAFVNDAGFGRRTN